uniref:Synaptobrevin, longin-like domain protein n=1 Tax=Tanacetum cinerariifolium TaxID=118510 RepID=A0A699IJB8_TANCI|nr:hypothetical protein [Tanacetum cinerariifolium]
MIAILEKYESNQDFHQIVDFVETSHIRIETTDEGTKILATIDGKLRTVSESSIRRKLKLNDEAGISSLPDAELFKNLQLMGYNILPNQKFTFQKGQFSHRWKIVPPFDSMLVPQGEGSGTPTESHHTPTSEASQSSQHELPSPSLPPVPTESLPTVIPSDNPPLRQYTRRARIAQSSALSPVANEPASPIRDDSQGEACPTDSGLEADQDRANIVKTFTLPSDSIPRVTSLAADEGSMQQKLNELTTLCTSLQRQKSEMIFKFALQELEINRLKARIKLLEDKDRGVAEQSGNDVPIKGKRLDEREEAAERVSDDTEEMTIILTSMDAASILTSGGVQVVLTAAEVATATVSIPTGSGVVSTARPTIPTAASIFTTATESTPYTRRKGKETMVESKTPKKKKIARDAEIARIHAEEELQMLIDGLDKNNETVAKYLQEYQNFAAELPIKRRIKLISDLVKYQDNYAKVLKYQTQQRKPLTRKQQREFYTSIQDFIPIGSKEEAERKDLNQLWALVKENLNIRSATSDKEIELWVELKRLYEPDVEDQLWIYTQNLMHAPVEWKLYDTCGVHHVTSKDKEIFMLVEKDYPLRKGLEIVMISYKLQVENYSQMANDLILKIYMIASSPRQQDD